jgi:virginiamycin B lyase
MMRGSTGLTAGVGLRRFKRGGLRLATVAGAVAAFWCWAAAAGAYVYWTSDATGAIGRADLDGSAANQSFIPGGSTGQAVVAVDGGHVYWTNDDLGTIGRSNLDGSGANQSFIVGLPVLAGVAVDGQHIYWSDDTDDAIGRANLDGSGVNQSFITGADFPGGVAVDGRHIYWANVAGDAIGRANLDGSGVNQSFIAGADGPASVAVDGQHVYWANASGDAIGRANLDGSGVNQSFVAASEPFAIAVDGGPAGTATPSPTSLSFASQPVGTFGPLEAVTVTNTGHGVLQFDGGQVTGAAPNDFLIAADTCSGASLPIGGACTISVRFGPGAIGARSATLALTGDDAAGPLQIPLSGAGDPLPTNIQGPPGAPGIPGPTGPTGASGAAGAAGTSGQAGKNGSNGVVRLVRCRTVRRTVVKQVHGKPRNVKLTRQVCTTRTVTGPARFTVAAARRATLTRAGVVYARGGEVRTGTHPLLVLDGAATIDAGRYTLRITWTDRGGHRHTTRQAITVIAADQVRR